MPQTYFDYLYQQDTLFRVPEPEPVLPAPNVPEPLTRQAAYPVAEKTNAEPESTVTFPPVEQTVPVEAAPATPPEPIMEVPPAPPLPVIPKVHHKILLMFDDDLLPSELILLEKILESVQLSLDQVDILNLAGLGLVNVRPVLASKRVHHFISFGVPFTQINLNIAMNRYEIRNLAGINFMLADPLSAIEADQKLKRNLWIRLRELFLGK